MMIINSRRSLGEEDQPRAATSTPFGREGSRPGEGCEDGNGQRPRPCGPAMETGAGRRGRAVCTRACEGARAPSAWIRRRPSPTATPCPPHPPSMHRV